MRCARCRYEMEPGKKQCPKCKNWHFAEEADAQGATALSDVEATDHTLRHHTGPWDRCFGPANELDPDGNGIAEKSVTLIGGMPGSGKSTLLLQIADAICEADDMANALYIAAEEDLIQLKQRALRLGIKHLDRIKGVDARGGTTIIDAELAEACPSIVFLDSLQGLVGYDAGNAKDAIEACAAVKEYCTDTGAPGILIAHVNKLDEIAGLNTLQHYVDATMVFDVHKASGIRALWVEKNRFGQAQIQEYFVMTATGLVHTTKPPRKKGKKKK